MPSSSLRQSATLKCLAPDNSLGNFNRRAVYQKTLCRVATLHDARGDRDSMISADYLKRIAVWSRDLTEREIEVARADVTTPRPFVKKRALSAEGLEF